MGFFPEFGKGHLKFCATTTDLSQGGALGDWDFPAARTAGTFAPVLSPKKITRGVKSFLSQVAQSTQGGSHFSQDLTGPIKVQQVQGCYFCLHDPMAGGGIA